MFEWEAENGYLKSGRFRVVVVQKKKILQSPFIFRLCPRKRNRP